MALLFPALAAGAIGTGFLGAVAAKVAYDENQKQEKYKQDLDRDLWNKKNKEQNDLILSHQSRQKPHGNPNTNVPKPIPVIRPKKPHEQLNEDLGDGGTYKAPYEEYRGKPRITQILGMPDESGVRKGPNWDTDWSNTTRQDEPYDRTDRNIYKSRFTYNRSYEYIPYYSRYRPKRRGSRAMGLFPRKTSRKAFTIYRKSQKMGYPRMRSSRRYYPLVKSKLFKRQPYVYY